MAELGGAGNIAAILEALGTAMAEAGLPEPASPWYFPTLAQHATLLEAGGFRVARMEHFPRPTPLAGGPDGLADWVAMFGGSPTAAVPAHRLSQVVARAGELAAPRLYRDGRRRRLLAAAVRGRRRGRRGQAALHRQMAGDRTGKRTWCSYGARPTPAPRPSRGSGMSYGRAGPQGPQGQVRTLGPGFVWSMANPLLYLAVFTLVFTFFLPNGVPKFAVLFMSGFLVWSFFNSATLDATGAVVGNANLVKGPPWLVLLLAWSASPASRAPAAGVLLRSWSRSYPDAFGPQLWLPAPALAVAVAFTVAMSLLASA